MRCDKVKWIGMVVNRSVGATKPSNAQLMAREEGRVTATCGYRSRRSVLSGVAAALLSGMAYGAPVLPPSCAQYFKAIDACMANAIHYSERTNTRAVEQGREAQQVMRQVEEELLRGVAMGRRPEVAAFCTSPQFVNGMVKVLTETILTLASARALDDDCASASNDLQLPQQ